MKPDGTGQTNLTNHPARETLPAWWPDGKKIAFTSDRLGGGSGDDRIYVMNADGTGQTRLGTIAVTDANPAWSPDGRKIASMIAYPYLQVNIMVMNARMVRFAGACRCTRPRRIGVPSALRTAQLLAPSVIVSPQGR